MKPSTAIVITAKGDPDSVNLDGCYFMEIAPLSGEFFLFAPDTSQIPTHPSPVQSGGPPFTFRYQKLHWTITDFVYSESLRFGQGNWSALPAKSNGKDPEDPETGTFQAQGGLGAGDDLSASASASA